MQIRSARCLAGARDIVAAASPQAVCRKCIIHGEEANVKEGGAAKEARRFFPERQSVSRLPSSVVTNPG